MATHRKRMVRSDAGKLVACALGGVLLSGCLAQHSDLKQIDQRVNETRAKLRAEIVELREADLSRVQGRLDESAHQITALGSRLDDLEHRAASQQQLKEQLGHLAARLDTISATVASVTKTFETRLESQNHTMTDRLAQFGRALADFKLALTGLGEKLVQEEQWANELSATLSRRTDTLTAKVESDANTTTAHLNDVNKSVVSVAKTLETVGGRVMSRVEEQDRRLDELAKTLQTMSAQITAVTHTVAQLRDSRAGRGSKQAGKAEQEHRSSQRQDQHTAPSSGSPDVRPAPTSESAKDTYDRTMQKFKQGELDKALRGFSEFLVRYPTSTLAPNAQYWLGECYYGKKEFVRAIEAFDRVKLAYPSSEKVPAALLKKGFAYLALKDRSRAVSALKQVVDTFPKTPEADKAWDKLTQLNQTR